MNTDYNVNQTSPNTTLVTFLENVPIKNWFIYSFLILINIFTAFGNALVCIAVYQEKKLQTSRNLFLISLAIADFMVALFVMPTSLVIEILRYYPFSPLFCIVWILLDVLCCTSSIHHMSAMALDRYLTIKFPLKYGRNKSKRIALLKIFIIWLSSFALCSPLLILSIMDETNLYDASTKQCMVFDKKFRLYGSILAFYIPFIIMLIAYVSTIRILKKVLDQKLYVGKEKRRHASETSSFLKINVIQNFMQNVLNRKVASHDASSTINRVERFKSKSNDDSCLLAPRRQGFYNLNIQKSKSLDNIKINQSDKLCSRDILVKHSSNHRPIASCKRKKKSINEDSLITDNQNCELIGFKVNEDSSTLYFNKKEVNNVKKYSQSKRTKSINYPSIKCVARNEKKALKVLIIIFSVFCTLWSPFFILNTMSVIFEDFTRILLDKYESQVYSVLTWLGYGSSMANPIVYTMFSKSFRTAFVKIFTKRKGSDKNSFQVHSKKHSKSTPM